MTRSYDVIRSFEAEEAINGKKRRFLPGEVVLCGTSQGPDVVVVEVEHTFFLTPRSVFETCCKFKDPGGGIGV